ncbi:MAG: hypothetical protein RL026_505 [Pseudomonadota bacterium]|jgi:UDP-N-acetylmuramoyl-tripeptide--D-alanyl-D-alanine ligase
MNRAGRHLQDLAQLAAADYAGPDLPYAAISTDTRRLQPGDVYWALRGERFDGNAFVAAARAAGAVAAVVDRPVEAGGLPVLQVADGLLALQRAAAGWRRRHALPVLAVAGSNGKTTTKEMLAAVMAQRGRTLATQGNLNNHIGVPLTLLRLEPQDLAAVVEIGTNAPGEVAALAALVQPQYGLVTNAGAEHLEGFGTLEAVAREEGALAAAVPAGGTVVLNHDDPYLSLWRGMTAATVVTFGLSEGADWQAVQLTEHWEEAGLRSRFLLRCPLGEQAVTLRLGGRHNVRNALAAAATACAAGATLAQAVQGLGRVEPVGGRLQPRRSHHGARLLDDSYNANPDSMRAGIDVLVAQPGRPWMVLADMAELGAAAAASHADIGRYARERGIERLYCAGPLSVLAAEAFGSGARWFDDVPALAEAIDADLGPGICLLVKGSRSNRLERVVARLTHTAATGGH